jgi:hypothetical protein
MAFRGVLSTRIAADIGYGATQGFNVSDGLLLLGAERMPSVGLPLGANADQRPKAERLAVG